MKLVLRQSPTPVLQCSSFVSGVTLVTLWRIVLSRADQQMTSMLFSCRQSSLQ